MQPLNFTDKKLISELTAKMLFEIEADQFISDKPFIFNYGTAIPVYIECRKIISLCNTSFIFYCFKETKSK